MNLARNVATVGSATLFSRVLGFARDVAIAAVFGAGVRADAFFVAFQLANLFRRMLAEGALNAAIVPLYLRARDEHGEDGAGAFAGRLIGSVTVALVIAVAILAFAMPAAIAVLAPGFLAGGPRMTIAVELARLMLPYLAFAGPVAVLMGVLNANGRFGTAAFATAAFNATMLASLGVVFMLHAGDSPLSGRIVAFSVALAGVSQLALVGLAIWRGPSRVTPLSVSFGADSRRFFALAIPGLVASGIPQITVIAGVMIASSSTSAVSWIYYANRLIELPLGIVGIAVGTVLVPAFAHAIRTGNKEELGHVESRGIELALGLALPATIALIALAEPIVRVLFERGAFHDSDTAATAAALAAFSLGLPAHVLVKTFSPIFFAREDTATPMHAALFGLIVAIIGSLILMPLFGHIGVALAIAASGWASAGLLGVLIARRIGFSLDAEARFRLPRIVAAAVVMGVTIEAAHRAAGLWLDAGAPGLGRALLLGVLIVLGLSVYVLGLKLLKVTSPRDLARVFSKGL